MTMGRDFLSAAQEAKSFMFLGVAGGAIERFTFWGFGCVPRYRHTPHYANTERSIEKDY